MRQTSRLLSRKKKLLTFLRPCVATCVLVLHVHATCHWLDCQMSVYERYEKSPASSVSPQTGMNFPVVQFWGSNSRQKPSYRHPRARVPMLSMVKYSCTVQLFRTAVLCHVINRSVTSSDTSSQERVDKTTRKIWGERRKKDRERGLFLRHGGACPWCNGRSLPAIMRDFAKPPKYAFPHFGHWHVGIPTCTCINTSGGTYIHVHSCTSVMPDDTT